MRRDVYSGCLRLHGEEHENTLVAASNYASSLCLKRFEEAKALLPKRCPWRDAVSVRVHDLTLNDEEDLREGALRRPGAPRSTISARP